MNPSQCWLPGLESSAAGLRIEHAIGNLRAMSQSSTDFEAAIATRSEDFVAKFWADGADAIQGRTSRQPRESDYAAKAEKLGNEMSLADRIAFGQPSHSALSDHVYCLDTLQRPRRTLKGAIPLRQLNSFLYCSVILFNHVVKKLALA